MYYNEQKSDLNIINVQAKNIPNLCAVVCFLRQNCTTWANSSAGSWFTFTINLVLKMKNHGNAKQLSFESSKQRYSQCMY